MYLADSFNAFLLETVETAEAEWNKEAVRLGIWFPRYLLYYTAIFRTFRAAETLLLSGYPLSGYALLRDLKDRAMILAALGGGGLTSFEQVSGNSVYRDDPKVDLETVRRARKKSVPFSSA